MVRRGDGRDHVYINERLIDRMETIGVRRYRAPIAPWVPGPSCADGCAHHARGRPRPADPRLRRDPYHHGAAEAMVLLEGRCRCSRRRPSRPRSRSTASPRHAATPQRSGRELFRLIVPGVDVAWLSTLLSRTGPRRLRPRPAAERPPRTPRGPSASFCASGVVTLALHAMLQDLAECQPQLRICADTGLAAVQLPATAMRVRRVDHHRPGDRDWTVEGPLS